jgi:hypothetical protein
MPEQLLYLPQIGTHIEQMCRIAVPEPMGVHMLIQIRAHGALSQYSARLASSQPARTSLTSWPKRDEKRLAQHTRMPPNLEPGVQRAARLLRDRNDAFLAALPHDANLACP